MNLEHALYGIGFVMLALAVTVAAFVGYAQYRLWSYRRRHR